jgi:hypothetical protein
MSRRRCDGHDDYDDQAPRWARQGQVAWVVDGHSLAGERAACDRAYAESRHNRCSGCGAVECPGCDPDDRECA